MQVKWVSVVACALALSGISAPSVRADDNKGWALLQTSPHAGVFYLYLNKGGLAAVNKKMGVTIVTKSPQWNVVMYNDKTRVYYLSSLKDWQGQSLDSSGRKTKQMVARAASTPPRKGKSGTVAGLPSTQYFYDAQLPSTGVKRYELWVTNNVEVPDQLPELLKKIYGMNADSARQIKGLPLKVSYFDETGKRVLVVDTLKAQPQNIPTQSFTYPASYTRVSNEIEVFVDEKGRKTMASLMEDMGDGSDIDQLLGNTGTGSHRYSGATGGARPSSYGSSTYRPSSTYTRTATTTTTTQRRPPAGQPQNNDWFGSIFNAFGGKK